MATTLLRFFAVLILLGISAVAFVQLTSTSWPRTTGIVEKGNWASRDEVVFGSRYRVRYVYEVNGERHTGYRIGFAARTHVVPIVGVRDPRQPREGDEVEVYYAPWYPKLALLVPGPSPTLVWWGALSVLVALMLWMFSRVAKEPVF